MYLETDFNQHAFMRRSLGARSYPYRITHRDRVLAIDKNYPTKRSKNRSLLKFFYKIGSKALRDDHWKKK